MNLPGPLPRHAHLASQLESTTLPPGSVDVGLLMETLRRTKEQMQTLHRRLSEPIAIVGVGCRFPDASDPQTFWEMLDAGRQVRLRNGGRWDESLKSSYDKQPGRITANLAGYLEQVDHFDAPFFGISGREASTLDPQQRLLLEVAWETFEFAGIDPSAWRGERVGAFIGICSSDYLHRLTTCDRESIDTYWSTGNSHGAAAGRLSFVMDWRGPSVAVDTACSSSLTAVHLASRALRSGECDLAIAMGVNVILAPELSISLSQAGMLSPTGRCHTFSASADGFARGEGCGGVLMKRLSDAITDGDEILCVVRGSAINQDGRSIGLTAPNGHAQVAVIQDALADANLNPADVDYIEAHGTGTPLGDPVELDALRQVFASTRSLDRPLKVGSVKSNLGHLEGAAGIAGIIKTALALHHRRLPAHRGGKQLSPAIDWTWPVEVTQYSRDWTSQSNRSVAGVSSFGFGGSNAHVILASLETAEPAQPLASHAAVTRPTLFVLSAKTSSALESLSKQIASNLRRQPRPLIDVCATMAIGRASMDYRSALIVESIDDLIDQLENGPKAESIDPKLDGIRARYLAGENLDWREFFNHFGPVRRCIGLPTYAFDRRRRWFDESKVSDDRRVVTDVTMVGPTQQNHTNHRWLGRRLDIAGSAIVFESELATCQELQDHVVNGICLLPASAYLELMTAIGREATEQPGMVHDVRLHRPIRLNGTSCRVQIHLEPDDSAQVHWPVWNGTMFCLEQGQWLAAATFQYSRMQSSVAREPQMASKSSADQVTEASTHYELAEMLGLEYGPAFRGLRERWNWYDGEKTYSQGIVEAVDGLNQTDALFHPAWLDACFQVGAGLFESPISAWLPVEIHGYRFYQSPTSQNILHVHAELTEATHDRHVELDLWITDERKTLIAEIKGLRLREIPRVSLATPLGSKSMTEHLHHRVADIMGMSIDEVPLDQPLNSLGLDSLMAFELRDELERQFSLQVPMELFFETMTLGRFFETVNAQIVAVNGSGPKTDDWVEGAI